MDYISFYCGLYTILAYCANLGETTGEMRSLGFSPLPPQSTFGRAQMEATIRQKTKGVAVVGLNQVSLRVTLRVWMMAL